MKIRQKSLDEMNYTEMLIEIQNVNERLQDKTILLEERKDLYRYLKKLNREIHDYEMFHGLNV